MKRNQKRFCILLGDGFDDVEAIAVIDLLRRADIAVDIFGVGARNIQSHVGINYTADYALAGSGGTDSSKARPHDLDERVYAGLLLPGGPGIAKLLGNDRVIDLIQAFHRSQKLLYAICGAPLLLAKAGILDGYRYTCLPSVAPMIGTGTRTDEQVVVDGTIVTAQALGASIEGALTLIGIIASKEKRDEIASSYYIKELSMEKLKVNESTCASCGQCVKVCPMNIIALDESGHPYKRSGGADCMDCGHCAAICPVGAITSMLAPAVGPLVSIEQPVARDTEDKHDDGTDFLSFMKNRRSCRSFQKRSVPWELIERALDAARYAPSAKNTQPVEWTVVTDEAAIGNLAKTLHEKGRSNPELAKRYAFVDEGEDPIFRGAPILVAVHSDPKNVLFPGDGIIAATSFDLAAQALGLGTCWSGTAFSAADSVKKLARIPDHHNLHAVFMLGFPMPKWHGLPERKPLRVNRI